jgi:maltooligosyltrehalose trehalohydrolase
VDALRVDAVHAIYDFSARTFLSELAETVHEAAEQLNRRIHVIPESALNDVRLIQVPELGGMGLDAQWNDDFHHALHTALTGEQGGYYQDFGGLGDLAKAFRKGFVYAGQYSVYRKRRHGNSSREVPARRFVVFSQNHDQVGNRMMGDRLSALVNFEKLKLAAGVLLLSPFLPLIFMGEEYGESAPFPYFISHSDPDLVQAVREGRRREFQTFAWQGEPPDPADPAVFRKARIQPSLRRKGRHRILFDLYCELIRMRKEIPALFHLNKDQMRVRDLSKENILMVHRWSKTDRAFGVFHFGDSETSVNVPLPPGHWSKELDSSDARWEGPGSTLPVTIDSQGEVALTLVPQAFALFTQEVPL